MFALQRQDTRGADIEGLALVFGAAAVVAAWTFPLWRDFYPFDCPLKNLVGIPCAFCGGTRAVHFWAHGHWFEAWWMNPLVAVGSAFVTLYLPYALFCVLMKPERRIRLTGLGDRATPSMRWAIRAGAVTVVLGNWIYLIAVGR